MAVKIRQTVNTAFVARKAVFLIECDGVTTNFPLTHGFNNQFPDVSAVENNLGVIVQPQFVNANQCAIVFDTAPASGRSFRITVIG